ncbi:hypothetical protein [Nonomuraea longicatena]|uniref:hypothetical protein n=1 Tax=Nonomuraea longicatena TaxID=83682 RepID=UPI0031D126A0
MRIPILGDKPHEFLRAQAVSLCELNGPPAERGIEVNERSVKVKEGKVLHVADLRDERLDSDSLAPELQR